jgi:predicted nicotinamide N-methyase
VCTLPRILELGSGTGVLGFALATLGCEVVLTDPGLDVNLTDEDSLAHVQVNTLDVLKESSEVNRKRFTTPSELDRKVIPFHAAVRKLAWGSDQDIQAIQREFGLSEIGSESQLNLESWSLRSGFDVIVGSDILYDPHKFPYLLKTLKDLARDDTDILLCGPIRKVESQFLKLAERDFEISQPLRPGLKLPHSDHKSFIFCLRKKGPNN